MWCSNRRRWKIGFSDRRRWQLHSALVSNRWERRWHGRWTAGRSFNFGNKTFIIIVLVEEIGDLGLFGGCGWLVSARGFVVHEAGLVVLIVVVDGE